MTSHFYFSIRFFCFIFVCSFLKVQAQTFDVPATSTTGTYVITYSATGQFGLINENGVTIGGGSKTGSISVTKTTNGTYTYTMQNCDGGQFGAVCTNVPGSKSIVVNIGGSGGGNSGAVPIVGEAPLPPPTDSGSTTPVGALKGNFSVSESGAASYEIPVSVAEGIAGVKPQVSVLYSSQAGNGLLGIGASLNGVSAISRCRQTLHQDGAAKPISWNSDDRFCLNGQKLMLVAGSTYGAPGTEYKTEIDQFVKVTAVGGLTGNPDYFTVEAKDGSTTYYGYDSELSNNSRLTMSSGYHLSWAQSDCW